LDLFRRRGLKAIAREDVGFDKITWEVAISWQRPIVNSDLLFGRRKKSREESGRGKKLPGPKHVNWTSRGCLASYERARGHLVKALTAG